MSSSFSRHHQWNGRRPGHWNRLYSDTRTKLPRGACRGGGWAKSCLGGSVGKPPRLPCCPFFTRSGASAVPFKSERLISDSVGIEGGSERTIDWDGARTAWIIRNGYCVFAERCSNFPVHLTVKSRRLTLLGVVTAAARRDSNSQITLSRACNVRPLHRTSTESGFGDKLRRHW